MNTNLILKKVELEKTPQNQDFSLRSYLFLTFQNVNTSKCNIQKVRVQQNDMKKVFS